MVAIGCDKSSCRHAGASYGDFLSSSTRKLADATTKWEDKTGNICFDFDVQYLNQSDLHPKKIEIDAGDIANGAQPRVSVYVSFVLHGDPVQKSLVYYLVKEHSNWHIDNIAWNDGQNTTGSLVDALRNCR
jgi:hypothetical protein